MRRNLLLLFVLLGVSNAFAQTKQYEFEQEISGKKTGDDKASFSSILNSLGKFTSKDDASITFQPTLYGLGTIFNPKLKLQDNFIRTAFLRNFQLTLGITPSAESIFNIDDFQSGFSYAILNNKKLTAADYAGLIAAEPAQQRRMFNAALGRFIFDNRKTAEGAMARTFTNKALSASDIATMSTLLKDFLKKKLGITTDAELAAMASGFNSS